MKKLTGFSKKLFKNKRGQGMTEYILLLVVVVGLVMAFKGKISSIINSKIDTLSTDIGNVNSQ